MSEQIPILREPKARRRGNRKLIAVLFLLFLILLTVLFFNSSMSKISSITISGNALVSNEEILAAAELHAGDAYFGFSTEEVSLRIAERLPPVQEAIMAKAFPGKVSIHVQEYPAVAFEISQRGEMTAILAGGAQVELKGKEYVVDKPVLSMWEADDPHKAELSRLLGEIPPEQLADLSEIIPAPSKSYPDRIKIYTRTQFEVITAISLLREKLPTLHAVVETQEPGKLTLLLADTYTPYVSDASESEDSNEN